MKGVIVSGLSDHFMIFCTRKKQKTKSCCRKTVISRDINTYSSETFNTELEKLDWSEELGSSLDEEAWLGIKTKFISVLDNMAPLRKSGSKPARSHG